MEATLQMKKYQSEKILYLKFFLVVLAYGFNGTTYTAIPFLFYRSKLNCLDNQGQPYQCSLEEACSNPNGYTQVSDYPQILSITMDFDLYCDRKIIEAWVLTLANFAKIISFILLCIFPISKAVKEVFIYSCITIIGVQLCILNWIQTTEMFIIAFCVWYLFFTLFYGLVYTFFVENFPPQLAKYGPACLNISWPSIMVIYIGYTYIYGKWENSMVDFTGIPLLLIGITALLIYFTQIKEQNKQNSNLYGSLIPNNNTLTNKQQNSNVQSKLSTHQYDGNEKQCNNISNQNIQEYKNEIKSQGQEKSQTQSNKKFNFLKNYQFLFNDKDIRNNFLIWTLGWSCNGICYVGCYLQLNTLKGDLFFNSFSTTLCEVVAGLIGTFLVFRFSQNLKNIIIISFFTIGIAFVSCVFMEDPNNFNKSNGDNGPSFVVTLLYLFPIIVAKISYEINWTLLVTYQKQVIPLEYHQAQFSCSSLVGVIFSDFTPFYKYFAESIGFNTFVGFGLICLFSANSSRYYVEITSGDVKGNNNSTQKESIELLEMKILNSQQL